jgi:PST family polysaccharide transporter
MRRLHPWRADRIAAAAPLAPFARFGAAVLGVELLKALRLQADKLVIGALMGAETLGIYFMAFNAGLGLATSFSTAFSIVLFPHLCASPDRLGALRQALLLGLGIIAPVVALQSLLAPLYVPILLGPEWAEWAGLVSILCLAAIPGIVWSATAGWLRAEGRVGAELSSTAGMTVALIATTAATAPFGLYHVAGGYLVVATLSQIGAALPALSALFPTRKQEV